MQKVALFSDSFNRCERKDRRDRKKRGEKRNGKWNWHCQWTNNDSEYDEKKKRVPIWNPSIFVWCIIKKPFYRRKDRFLIIFFIDSFFLTTAIHSLLNVKSFLASILKYISSVLDYWKERERWHYQNHYNKIRKHKRNT